VPAIVQLIHPAPTLAVTGLSIVLASVLALETPSEGAAARVALVSLSVLGSQVLIGALNDWADRHRDAGRRDKPIATGKVSARTALGVVGTGVAVQLVASALLGGLPLTLGVVASSSAIAYDLWLSRTALSPLPYLVSFGVLPLWIAAGVGAPLERVAPASLLVAPFAVAAHLVNVLRDFDADAAAGSRNLAQRIGRRRSHALAASLLLLTGIGIGIGLALAGRLGTWSGPLWLAGLLAIAIGARTPRGLWNAILLAAVTWTAAWALSTG
jgi:4-hydroxybenzoate polyprenyltransferase